MNIRLYIQQRNALTVLIALHKLPNPHWRAIKRYSIENLKVASLSDHSYERLCKQLVEIGLAEPIKRSVRAYDYRLTQYGYTAAEIIEKALTKIESQHARHQKKR